MSLGARQDRVSYGTTCRLILAKGNHGLNPIDSERSVSTSVELTGGAGFTFEDDVVAFYCVRLLLEDEPIGLPGTTTTKLLLQRGSIGDPMDDLVVVGIDGNGTERKLALQIKTSLTVSSSKSNATMAAVVRQAFDTIHSDAFTPDRDRLGVVVQSISEPTRRNVSIVSDTARNSLDPADFMAKIASRSQGQRKVVQTFRELLCNTEGGVPTDEEIFVLLRHFVIIRLDLDGTGAVDAAAAVSRLKDLSGTDINAARTLWERLQRMVREGEGLGASYSRASVATRLGIGIPAATAFRADMNRIRTENRATLAAMNETIDGIRLDRPKVMHETEAAIGSARLVLVTGEAGTGKSAILRRIAQMANERGSALVLADDRLAQGGWTGQAMQLGLSTADPNDVLATIAQAGEPMLLIDGLDRIVPDGRAVIVDVLNAVADRPRDEAWTVLATLRAANDHELPEWLELGRLEPCSRVVVGPLDDEEARALASMKPEFQGLLFASGPVRTIARRPFFMSVMVQMKPSDDETFPSEIDLATAWWRRGGHSAEGTRRLTRRETLLQAAKCGAASLGHDVSPKDLDSESVADLLADGVLQEERNGLRVGFAHDVFFDWAFYHRLLDQNDVDEWIGMLRDAADVPALARAVELLSIQEFDNGPGWCTTLRQLEEADHLRWLRSWCMAPFLRPIGPADTPRLRDAYLNEGNARLDRLLRWFLATRTKPIDPPIEQVASAEDRKHLTEAVELVRVPVDDLVWSRLCSWLVTIADDIPSASWIRVGTVFETWQNRWSLRANPVSNRLLDVVEAWLLRLETHSEGDQKDEGDHFTNVDVRELAGCLRRLVLASSFAYPDRGTNLLERYGDQVPTTVVEDVLVCSPRLAPRCAAALCHFIRRSFVEELPIANFGRRLKEHAQRVSDAEALPQGSRERDLMLPVFPPDPLPPGERDRMCVERTGTSFFPSSPERAPFAALFEHAPEDAVTLCRALSNHASLAWREMETLSAREPVPIVVEFSWGSESFWGGRREYLLYRGAFGPHILGSAFMALERWGMSRLDDGTPLDELLRNTLPGQTHVGVLGVAASWVLYAGKVSQDGFALATNQRLWHLDFERVKEIDRQKFKSNEIGAIRAGEAVHLKAIRELNHLPHRARDIRTMFAEHLGSDERTRRAYLEAVARFPDELPFEYEEDRNDPALVGSLRRDAEVLAAYGEEKNYEISWGENGAHVRFNHETDPDADAARADALIGFGHFQWAENALFCPDDMNAEPAAQQLATAVRFRRAIIEKTDGSPTIDPFTIAGTVGVASVLLRLADEDMSEEIAWAKDVLSELLAQPWTHGPFMDGVPWRPLRFAIPGLRAVVDRAGEDHGLAAEWLLRLACHPDEDIGVPAFLALGELGSRLRMIALQLRVGIAIRTDPIWPHMDEEARQRSRMRRHERLFEDASNLTHGTNEPSLPELPDAWTEIVEENRSRPGRPEWRDPDVWLDLHSLLKTLQPLPLATWLDGKEGAMLVALAASLLCWTKDRVRPEVELHGRPNEAMDEWEWNEEFPKWLGRVASSLPMGRSRSELIENALGVPGKPGLAIATRFAIGMIADQGSRHGSSRSEGVDVLLRLADRLPEVSLTRRHARLGDESERLISVLLGVDHELEESSPIADLRVVDRVLDHGGWHPAVVSRWLELVNSSSDYPVADLLRQLQAVFESRPGQDWDEHHLARRISRLLGRMKEADRFRAQDLGTVNRMLDALIEEGDGTSGALQASSMFRGAPSQET